MNATISMTNKLRGAVTMANSKINGGASPYPKGASGDIITITDGAENTPLKSAVVNIEPVQDLHGYDYPWPGGGGKNLISPILSPANESILSGVTESEASEKSIKLTSASYTYACKRIFYELPAGTYTFKYLATSSDSYTPVVSIYNKATGGLIMNGNSIAPSTPRTFTLAETTTLDIRLFVTVNTAAVRTVTFSDIQLESGSSVAAWTPYSNICPISGWSEANVKAAGKNILDVSNASLASNVVSAVSDDGVISFKDVTAQWSSKPIGVAFLKKGVTYTISGDMVYGRIGASLSSTVFPQAINAPDISPAVGSTISTQTLLRRISPFIPFISNADQTVYFWFCSDMDYASYHTTFSTGIQLELGSVATAYTTPTLTPITISLGQTVYGGTLDALAGKMVIEWASVEFAKNLSTVTLDGHLCYRGALADVKNVNRDGFICSHFHKPSGSINGNPQNGEIVNQYSNYYNIVLRNDELQSITDWNNYLDAQKAAGTPVQVVYKLATPIEVDLTPQTIKTLLGTNNIWADAGEMSIEYYPAAASIVSVLNRSSKVYTSIPLGKIRYETYQITPQQTIDLDSYRSENGNLLRNPVATKCKIEFNTPLMTDSEWADVWRIIKAGFNNNTERKLKLRYYDTLSATYKTGYFYVPDVQTTIRNIEEGAGVINYNEIRIAFIEY